MPVGTFASAVHIAGGGFSPTDIANLTGWWDASDAATFTFSSGVVVSQWGDKSSNGFHVATAETTRRPSRNGTLNGLTTVVFNGDALFRTSAPINNSSTGAFTIFAVARATSLSSDRSIIDGDDPDTGGGRVAQLLRTTGSQIQSITFTSGGSPSFAAGGSLSTATPYLFTVRCTGTATEVFVAGASVGSSSQGDQLYSATMKLTIGAWSNETAQHWSGDIAEICCYSRALTTGERGDVETYLETKWSTP